jgi:FkbM family methyltransferase
LRDSSQITETRERFTFINAAIAEEDGYKDFFYVSDDVKGTTLKLPNWWDQLGSFDINHISKHLDGELAPFITKSRIACQRLEGVLDRHAPEKIDLIHIDTEGYDYNVLLMFDLSRYRPKVILYESNHLSTDKKRSARDILKSAGYRVYNYVNDTLAVHPVW